MMDIEGPSVRRPGLRRSRTSMLTSIDDSKMIHHQINPHRLP